MNGRPIKYHKKQSQASANRYIIGTSTTPTHSQTFSSPVFISSISSQYLNQLQKQIWFSHPHPHKTPPPGSFSTSYGDGRPYFFVPFVFPPTPISLPYWAQCLSPTTSSGHPSPLRAADSPPPSPGLLMVDLACYIVTTSSPSPTTFSTLIRSDGGTQEDVDGTRSTHPSAWSGMKWSCLAGHRLLKKQLRLWLL